MATICRKLKNGIEKCWNTPGNFKGGKIKRNCRYCGKEFYVWPAILRQNKGKFCSQTCVRKAVPNAKGKHWKMPESFKKKLKQWTKFKEGEGNINWIKDRNKIKRLQQRDNSEYKRWVKAVKKRDNWKCKINNQDCSGYCEVHHILPWRDFPELRYNINNGIALCQNHHSKRRIDEQRLMPIFQELVRSKV